MKLTEPINLQEWKAPRVSHSAGRLFSCGRPGRATYGAKKVAVPEDIIEQWANGLPRANPRHIVSLLGRKTTGASEFIYYPFRSATETGTKPTFEEWLKSKYVGEYVVHEFPTTDARPIEGHVLAAAIRQVFDLLEAGHTVIVIDSAGVVRSRQVCEATGYILVTQPSYKFGRARSAAP